VQGKSVQNCVDLGGRRIIKKKRYFIPVHGEYRNKHIHSGLARESGIPEEDIFILENGDVLEIDGDNAELVDKVPTGMVFVDGFEIGDAEGIVLRDRQQLAGDGIIIAVVTVDAQSGQTVAPPELVARGFLHNDDRLKDVLDQCGEALDELMEELGAERVTGQKLIREDINQRLSELVYQRTKRRPLIMPVVVEV
jgi:ribonuclease J